MIVSTHITNVSCLLCKDAEHARDSQHSPGQEKALLSLFHSCHIDITILSMREVAIPSKNGSVRGWDIPI